MRRPIQLAAVLALALPALAWGAPPPAAEPVSLARVDAGARIEVLAGSFDLTEYGRDGRYDVVLHPGDRARLERLGFGYEVLIPDLAALDVRERAAEWEAQLANPETRLTYRTYADYEADMRALAQAHPDLVRLLTLPYRTHEGRLVYGVEIGGNVERAASDGRPTAYLDGLHHAREWPSAELPIMFAQDLVDEYTKGTAEIVELLDGLRVIIVPVVNADGFVRSRETVSDWVAPLPGATALAGEFAYHRKNMRRKAPNALVELGQGVDPNRNYPFHWGGPGASASSGSQTFFGPAPGSEPEVANVLSVLRSNQVVAMVTNHTYGDLVLRPWGDTSVDPPDEAALKKLGNEMAAINKYRSITGIDLYPTTGTTDDWLYGVTGGFGFTFEIGSAGRLGLGNETPADPAGFHPQYNLFIPVFYERNRGAYLRLLEAARDPSLHAVLTGTAPNATRLTLRKTATVGLGRIFEGRTSYTEELVSSIRVGNDRSFTWHVNPSPLPETVARVNAGLAPASALERYVLEIRAHGKTTTQEILLVRGQTLTVDVPA